MKTQNSYSADIKELIADSFLQLLQNNTIDSITVRQLTEECSISRNTFYYHYKDIFAVIEYLCSRILERAKEEYIQQDDLIAFFMTTIQMFNNNIIFFNKVIRSKWAQIFLYYLSVQIEDAIESVWINSLKRNTRLSQEDLMMCVSVVTYGLLGNVIRTIENNIPISEKSLARGLYRIATGQISMQDY